MTLAAGSFAGSAQAQLSTGTSPYFLDEAQEIEVMESGPGWQKLSMWDGDKTKDPEVVIAVTAFGVRTAPLPGTELKYLREELSRSATGNDVILVHQELAFLKAQGVTQLPEKYSGMTEALSFGCSDEVKTKSESWDFDETPSPQTYEVNDNVSVNYGVNLPLHGQANLDVTYKVYKFLCVPYKVRLRNAHIYGYLNLAGDSNLSAFATIVAEWEKEWRLADPKIGTLRFSIGPIPVKIDFHLPIDVGARVRAELTGTVAVAGDYGVDGTFDYTCDMDTCWGSNTFSDSFDISGTDTSVEMDIEAEVWAKVQVRAELYDDDFFYAQVGARGFATGHFWGYYGSTCGDADGDGHNETVRALALEANAGYDWVYGIGGIVSDREWTSPGGRYFLGWWDLLGTGGSTALSPMISGPEMVELGETAEYQVRMRPCYPYSEKVNLTMTPSGAPAGDWNGNLFINNPQSNDPSQNTTTVSTTFSQEQWVSVKAFAPSDAKGRKLRTEDSHTTQAVSTMCSNDTADPTVSITSPVNGAQLNSGPVAFTANASDDVEVDKVQFFINNTLVSSDEDAPYSYLWQASEGSYSLKARVWDLCGNYTTHTINVTVDPVDVCDTDTTPPSVSLDAPVHGAILDAGDVALAASASDANGIASVIFLVNDVQVGSDFNAPYDGTWNASPGFTKVTARAIDACGLVSEDISWVTIEDTTPTCDQDSTQPNISLVSPTASDSLSPGVIQIQANASDATGIEKVQFFIDGVLEHADFTSAYTYDWNAGPGAHEIKVRAWDNCGNFKAHTVNVNVGDPAGCDNDNVQPTIILQNPANGATVAAGQTMTIDATATDTSGIEKVQFFVDGVLLGADFTSPYEIQWTPTAGSHEVKARAIDNCSNLKADTHNVTAQ